MYNFDKFNLLTVSGVFVVAIEVVTGVLGVGFTVVVTAVDGVLVITVVGGVTGVDGVTGVEVGTNVYN